jgi:hypothetical protein
VRVHVERSGGLADIPRRGSFDTTGLAPDEATPVDAALRGLLDQPEPAGPPTPDAFTYRLAITDGEATHHVAVRERDVPETLRPLIRSAIASGDVG